MLLVPAMIQPRHPRLLQSEALCDHGRSRAAVDQVLHLCGQLQPARSWTELVLYILRTCFTNGCVFDLSPSQTIEQPRAKPADESALLLLSLAALFQIDASSGDQFNDPPQADDLVRSWG